MSGTWHNGNVYRGGKQAKSQVFAVLSNEIVVEKESLVFSSESSLCFKEKDGLKCSTVDRVPDVGYLHSAQIGRQIWIGRAVWNCRSVLLENNSVRFVCDKEPLDWTVTRERELGDNPVKKTTRHELGHVLNQDRRDPLVKAPNSTLWLI